MTGSWTTWVCDTITGNKLLRLDPVAQNFTRSLNAMGSGSSTFQLVSGDGIPWAALTTWWSRTIVICRNDIPVYAGIINGDSSYSQASQQLTVPHADLRTILSARFPFGTIGYWADEPTETIPGQFVPTNLSFRAAAAAAVVNGTNFTPGYYSLPIVLPSTTETGTFTQAYPNYNLLTVEDVIEQIQTLGCDIDFQPGWSGSNTLQWTMRTATPPALLLTGNAFEFNQTSATPPLSNVTYVASGAKQMTGQITVGNGSEQDKIIGGVGLGNAATIPAVDRVTTELTATTKPQAAAFSAAALVTYGQPTRQFSFTLQAGDAIAPVEQLLLGSSMKIWFKGDPYIPDGWATTRLVGFSGDLSESIVPSVQ